MLLSERAEQLAWQAVMELFIVVLNRDQFETDSFGCRLG